MKAEQEYIPAKPRTAEEVGSLPGCPAVTVAAQCRGIGQVVHFTTMSGAVGIVAAKSVLSRKRVSSDKYLEHVYQPNAAFRKDLEWLDYINLSVERINDWMFSHSTKWHPAENNPWVVLSFSPSILAHPGVVFTTTNNIYPACERAEGIAGFHRMFGEVVRGRYSQCHVRNDDMSTAWPTHRQAEVLYPGELSISHLQRIDVQAEESVDTIHGILGAFGMKIPVCHAPEVFE